MLFTSIWYSTVHVLYDITYYIHIENTKRSSLSNLKICKKITKKYISPIFKYVMEDICGYNHAKNWKKICGPRGSFSRSKQRSKGHEVKRSSDDKTNDAIR